MSQLDRLIARTRVLRSGCWEWVGCLDDGYGSFFLDGRKRKAHIASFILFGGTIPAGHVIDHLCRKRDCVNPFHLEPVTQKVNVLRGVGIAARNSRKTHCPEGHDLTGDNLYVFRGMRYCRTCQKRYRRDYVLKKRNEKAFTN